MVSFCVIKFSFLYSSEVWPEVNLSQVGWPTIPVCPEPRRFPGHRTFISKTRSAPGKPGWLHTQVYRAREDRYKNNSPLWWAEGGHSTAPNRQTGKLEIPFGGRRESSDWGWGWGQCQGPSRMWHPQPLGLCPKTWIKETIQNTEAPEIGEGKVEEPVPHFPFGFSGRDHLSGWLWANVGQLHQNRKGHLAWIGKAWRCWVIGQEPKSGAGERTWLGLGRRLYATRNQGGLLSTVGWNRERSL